MAVSFFNRFRDISIAKKLYFAVGIMAMLIAIELLTLWFAITTLSSVRAFVGGEGLWSKGEKDAVYHLQQYGYSHNETDYNNFLKVLQVPLGDHKTRIELFKKDPDMEIARQGFREGRNHPSDVDGMINLFRRFHRISYISRAIVIWSQADSAIAPLMSLGAQLHSEITSSTPSQSKIDGLLMQINSINENLTGLEDEFSFTLGEGSRWLEKIVLRLLFAVALTVEISGLLLTISVSRGIQRGLKSILTAAKKIGKGDFSAKAKAYSGDEIGMLANSFNNMAAELGQATDSLKSYARRLEQSNESLKQFAYVASHDLKEPLRKINNFTSRIQDDQGNTIDEKGKVYLDKIQNASIRMQKLIDDILNFSHLGASGIRFLPTDLNTVVNEVIADKEIDKNSTKITVSPMPVIQANASQLSQLFHNIIGNALKFKSEEGNSSVEISAEEITGSQLIMANGIKAQYRFSGEGYETIWNKERFCKITIKDNGIGFEPAYADRVFEVFQRLNGKIYEGTGIGLAICKRIAENHHGKISAESEPGRGATFNIILPFSQVNFEGN